MTINYELGKQKNDGSRKVYIIVSQGSGRNNRKRLATDIYIEKNEITKSGKIKNNFKLNAIESFIIETKKGLIEEKGTILSVDRSAEEVALKIRKVNDSMDYIAFADKWIERQELKGKKNYRTFLNSLIRFNGSNLLSFDDITYEYLENYKKHLSDRPRAQSMYLAAMKHIWNQADKMYDDLLPKSPFRKFDIPKQKSKGQRAVDMDTLLKIFNYKGKRAAEFARDCYMLSFCLCGMNAVDLYYADTIKSGKICYERTKTKDRREDNAYIEISIPTILMPLLEKYKGKERVFNFSETYSTPEQFTKNINLGLGLIFDVIKDYRVLQYKKYDGYKVKQCPTMYTARHTWATIARNDCKISKDVINDALVHVDESMRVTDLYIKKSFAHIDKANAKVIKYVFGK